MIRRDGNIVIVSCDVCDASFRQWGNAFAARAEAIRRSWLCGDTFLARCPQCAACPDCGAVCEAYNAAHRRGTHHRVLTLCTERAREGLAPAHPVIIDARGTVWTDSLRPELIVPSDAVFYGTDALGRMATYSLSFAAVEHIEEFHHPAATLAVTAAKLCRDHGLAWWDAWSQACGKGARGLARRVPAHRRADPWPGLERDASREALDAQMVMTDATAERVREIYEVSP